MDLVRSYFPEISITQIKQLESLAGELLSWNEKINVVSRKDIGHLEERHILHSLAIAKFISFKPGTTIVDVGTGGGFPGLPLAIMFPECHFTLVDSIAKKIRVVNELSKTTGLKNIEAFQARAEHVSEQFDFVISRAVTAFPQLYRWTKKLVKRESRNDHPNGIISLKGGDLGQEIAGFGKKLTVTELSTWFKEEWFESKKLVYLPL